MSPIFFVLRSAVLMLTVGLFLAHAANSKKHTVDWQRHGGDALGNQYSPLAQINTRMTIGLKSNATRLS
jgi:glucose dehydrogenase